jgi:DNA (cytosine-5)-methyltransferase 1
MSKSKIVNFRDLREKAGLTVKGAAEATGYSLTTAHAWERNDRNPNRDVIELLNKIGEQRPKPHDSAFTFIDLFAGIGGMRRGFEAAGGKCVATCEWDRYSRETYSANFSTSDHPFYGDITTVAEEEVPDHDVLVAGFPCQPFSIAGVSKKNALGRAHGFACEAQGTLFFDIARILNAKRPAAFLLENVKNLLSHDKKRTFEVIRKVLEDDLGYDVSVRVIDAKGWLPQHRERTIIVGFREEVGFSLDDVEVPRPDSGPRLRSILHPEDGSEPADDRFVVGPRGKVSSKYTLTEHLWRYLKNYAAKHRAAGNGFGYGIVGPDDVARTLSARYYKDGSEILVRQRGKKPPRRLTPRECARLMGFDVSGRVPFEIPVSDTQAYRQFGNAVAVPVIESIARAMQPYLSQSEDRPLAQYQMKHRLNLALT